MKDSFISFHPFKLHISGLYSFDSIPKKIKLKLIFTYLPNPPPIILLFLLVNILTFAICSVIIIASCLVLVLDIKCIETSTTDFQRGFFNPGSLLSPSISVG